MRAIFARLGQEGIAGAAVVAAGVIGLALVRNYPVGQLSEFGPGFMPVVVTIGLILLGGAMFVRALISRRAETAAPDLRWTVMMIPLAVAIFALFVERLGLALTSGLGVLVASFASGEATLLERIAISLVLALLVTLIFGYGLALPVPIWPVFLRP